MKYKKTLIYLSFVLALLAFTPVGLAESSSDSSETKWVEQMLKTVEAQTTSDYWRQWALEQLVTLAKNQPSLTERIIEMLVIFAEKTTDDSIKKWAVEKFLSLTNIVPNVIQEKIYSIISSRIIKQSPINTDILKLITRYKREGNISRLKPLAQNNQLQAFLRNTENAINPSLRRALLSAGEPDSLETINVSLLSKESIVVAQNEADTLVRSKDGSLLTLKGQEAHKVYMHLEESLSSEVQTDPELHKLNIYLNPGHAFLSIKGKAVNELMGFYPNDNKETFIDDYRMEGIFANTLFGLSYLLSYALVNIPLGLTSYQIEMSIKMGLPAAMATIAASAWYEYLQPSFCYFDHKWGHLLNEADALKESNEKDHSFVSFILTKDQATKALDYIHSVDTACKNENNDQGLCEYNFLTRNCLVFAQDVFNAAGLKGNVFDYFSEHQLHGINYGSFNGFYDTKALFYAKFNGFLR